MTNVKIRTRYAPSPTGLFHIGGARTALFNYLFAKHYRGDFIVRIENTDTNRNIENGIQSQLENLKWLNIFADESPINPGSFGPYQQSEKLDIYRCFAKQLIDKGLAYYCFCDVDTLEQIRDNALVSNKTPKYDQRCLHLSPDTIKKRLDEKWPFSIRIRIPEDQKFTWNDLVRGEITIPSSSMSDIVIIKSNGVATYNFAVVIDDIQMKITHVLRGEEHITNTAYQLYIGSCIDEFSKIKYGHLSMITDSSGKKLSKRHGQVECFVETYRNLGYLPDAIVNFLLMLGWSPSDGKREIFNVCEVVDQFDIKNLNAAPSVFDLNKLKWINHEYIKRMSDSSYVSFVETFLENKLLGNVEKKEATLLLFKKQILYASQINDLLKQFFPKVITPTQVKKIINNINISLSDVQNLLKKFLKNLHEIKTWSPTSVTNFIRILQEESGLSRKNFFQPLRAVLTANDHGPELAGLIYVMGQARCSELVNSFLTSETTEV